MAELKVGGLALIIQSDDKLEIGKTVTTVKMLRNGCSFKAADKKSYQIDQPEYEDFWLCEGDVSIDILRKIVGIAPIPAAWLIPLDEDFTDEATKERALTHG